MLLWIHLPRTCSAHPLLWRLRRVLCEAVRPVLCVSDNALPVWLILKQIAQAQPACEAHHGAERHYGLKQRVGHLRAAASPGKEEMNGEPLMPWVCAPMLPRPKPLRMNMAAPLLQCELTECCEADQEYTEEQSLTLMVMRCQQVPEGMPALTVYLGRTCGVMAIAGL